MARLSSSDTFFSSKRLLKGLVLAAIFVVIILAVWTTGAAIMENFLFAKATTQMLQLIGTSRRFATADKNFGSSANEDILGELSRAGLVDGATDASPATALNPWHGSFTALAGAPSQMRIENSLPGRDCRRLALFFIKNGGDLGLSVLETRQSSGQVWQRFYDRDANAPAPASRQVEDACELAANVTLAMVFALR